MPSCSPKGRETAPEMSCEYCFLTYPNLMCSYLQARPFSYEPLVQ